MSAQAKRAPIKAPAGVAPAPNYTVTYRPTPFGDIDHASNCEHGPEHRFVLGFRVEEAGGQQQITSDGQICLKCGSAEHVAAEDWFDAWLIAHGELRGKCMAIDLRLSELLHAAAGTDDLRGVWQMFAERAALRRLGGECAP